MPILLLLGAEGVAELRDVPWLREATPDEAVAFKRRQRLSDLNFEALCLDDTGRPYFLVAILEDAPESILAKAHRQLRCLRLT